MVGLFWRIKKNTDRNRIKTRGKRRKTTSRKKDPRCHRAGLCGFGEVRSCKPLRGRDPPPAISSIGRWAGGGAPLGGALVVLEAAHGVAGGELLPVLVDRPPVRLTHLWDGGMEGTPSGRESEQVPEDDCFGRRGGQSGMGTTCSSGGQEESAPQRGDGPRPRGGRRGGR